MTKNRFRAPTGPKARGRGTATTYGCGSDRPPSFYGELAAATTSGVGVAKKQSKVFDPGGEL